MSTANIIITTIKQRIERTLFNRYQGYCPNQYIDSFRGDIQYHLWKDIPIALCLGASSVMTLDVEVSQHYNSIDCNCVRVTASIDGGPRISYEATIPKHPPSITNGTTLDDLTW